MSNFETFQNICIFKEKFDDNYWELIELEELPISRRNYQKALAILNKVTDFNPYWVEHYRWSKYEEMHERVSNMRDRITIVHNGGLDIPP